MIDKLLEDKFKNRFILSSLTTYDKHTFMPTYSIFDRYTGEITEIKIDSLAADVEMIVESILTEKVINWRDNKINSIIDGN